MAYSELNTLVKFYAWEIKLDNLHFERNIWSQDPHTIAILREKLVEEDSLKLMVPNMHALSHICLSSRYYLRCGEIF